MAIQKGDGAFCPRFHTAVELIGRRWTGAILRAMHSGESRFTDIASAIPGLHDRLLADRLRELEAAGVIERVVTQAPAGRVEYHLTEMGRDLGQVMAEIAAWAERWVPARECSASEQRVVIEEGCPEAGHPVATGSAQPARQQ